MIRRLSHRQLGLVHPEGDSEGESHSCDLCSLNWANFYICSYRANDAKPDLGILAFIGVCRAVLEQHGFIVAGNCETATK